MFKKKIKRLHDNLYLNESRYQKPKESSKELVNLIKKHFNNKIKKLNTVEYLDIGCANGELIYFIKKNFKNFNTTGLDILPRLLVKAKKYNSKTIFKTKNINSKKFNFKKKFDIITMNGVVSIFDNFETSFNNVLKLMHKNSIFYVHSHFNPYPYDVFVKYSEKKFPNVFQSGWNIFSLNSIQSYCKKKKLKIKIYPFNIKINLNPKKKDLVRTWTLSLKNKKFFTNGLNLLLSKYFLVITKK